jgi:hypothetical protein
VDGDADHRTRNAALSTGNPALLNQTYEGDEPVFAVMRAGSLRPRGRSPADMIRAIASVARPSHLRRCRRAGVSSTNRVRRRRTWGYQSADTGAGALQHSVEDAVRLGVDCVKMLMPWNTTRHEQAALTARVGKVISDCERWHIPLMLEPVLLGAPRTPEVVAAEEQAARIAFDLGAHIIKIAFPGEAGTRRLVEELGLPVVIAGGPRTGDAASTVDAVRETVVAGARGIIVGRNIWQRNLPEAHTLVAQLAELSRNGGRALQAV